MKRLARSTPFDTAWTNRSTTSLLTANRESWRRNDTWLGSVLTHAQEKPQYLDYSRHRQADYESITAAELSALAAEYLAPDRSARFIVRPAGTARVE